MLTLTQLAKATFTVERVEGRKVFSLYGLTFPALPAQMFTGRGTDLVHLKVMRKSGTEFRGYVAPAGEYPNGVSSGPPWFRIANLTLADNHVLSADLFEEGDVLSSNDLPPYFYLHILEVLQPRFKYIKTFHDRFFAIKKEYEEDLINPQTGQEWSDRSIVNEAILKFIDRITELFKELKDQPRWSEIIELIPEEFKHV